MDSSTDTKRSDPVVVMKQRPELEEAELSAAAIPNTAADENEVSNESAGHHSDDLRSSWRYGDSLREPRTYLPVLTVLGILYAGFFSRAIVVPFFFALLLNFALTPAVLFLRDKLRIPEWVSAGLILMAIGGMMLMVLMPLSKSAADWMDDAPKHFAQVERKLRSLRGSLENLEAASDEVEKITTLSKKSAPREVVIAQPKLSKVFFSTTGSFLMGASLTMVLLYFFLAAGDRFTRKVVDSLSDVEQKEKIISLGREVCRAVSRYLLSICVINSLLGITIAIVLYCYGLPSAVLWGAMAGILNFVPVVGAVLGFVLVSGASLLTFESVSYAMLPPTTYLLINLLESNLIEPYVVGRSVRLDPVAIVLALTLFGWMWGISGVILAVPLLAVSAICSVHLMGDSLYTRLVGRSP